MKKFISYFIWVYSLGLSFNTTAQSNLSAPKVEYPPKDPWYTDPVVLIIFIVIGIIVVGLIVKKPNKVEKTPADT